jgi:thioredoxin reductase
MNNKVYDVAIIGSGPSGIAAALELSKYNINILLIDNNERVGGQIYRASPPEFKSDESVEEMQIQKDLEEKIKKSNIVYKPNHTVWQISENFRIDGFTESEAFVWRANKIIVATGTTERIVPFSGWTNPGVIGLAATTIILKSQQTIPGKKIIIAGCGPLLLVVAYYTLKLGGKIEAIIDTNSKWTWLKNFIFLFSNIPLFIKGFKWILKILLCRIPIYSNCTVTSAENNNDFLNVEIKNLNNIENSKSIKLQCDTLCVGHGLIPSTDFSRLMNAHHKFDKYLGGWIPEVNKYFETSVPNFYQIGDASGVLGAMPAYEKGKIAAISIIHKMNLLSDYELDQQYKILSKKLKRLKIFGEAISKISFPNDLLYKQILPETIVCRCEDITRKDIENSANNGAHDLNQLKTWTRCGMGPCQGRTCHYATSLVLAKCTNKNIEDLGYWTGRAPVRPIPFYAAAGDFTYEEITKIESTPI